MKDIFGEEIVVGDLILSIGSGARWGLIKAGDYLGNGRMTVLWENGKSVEPKNREVGARVMALATKVLEKDERGVQYKLIDEWIKRTYGEG